jgi:hypothetical protein
MKDGDKLVDARYGYGFAKQTMLRKISEYPETELGKTLERMYSVYLLHMSGLMFDFQKR